MGLVAAEGEIPNNSAVQVGAFTTQTDVQSTWGDGSLRHGLVSFNATSTGNKTLTVIADPGGSHTPTWPSASVEFVVTAGPGNGDTFTATLPSFTGTNTTCNGAVCRRAWVLVTPMDGATPHPTLQVIFEVTSYAAGGHKVGICIQNVRNVAEMDKVTVDLTTTVDSVEMASLTKEDWIIYTGQRWYRTTLVSMTEADIRNDWEPWIAAGAIPRIVEASSKTYHTECPGSTDLGGGAGWGGVSCNYGTYFGLVNANQGDSENTGRDELTPFADWESRLFYHNTAAYHENVITTANQSGGWTMHVDKDGDGITVWKMTDDNSLFLYPGFHTNSQLEWPSDGTYSGLPRGGLTKELTPGYPSAVIQIDVGHLPESNYTAYLLTGERFYLDQMRFQASWALYMSADATEDALYWPSWETGRQGDNGYMYTYEFGREFGRPFRVVARAAWAMPDALSADQSYFQTYTEKQFEIVGAYVDYINGKGWDGGSWAEFIGFVPAFPVARGAAITSTTGATPTVISTTSDTSVSQANDHGMQTGDRVTLSGFSGGASGLNGVQTITRVNATSFSVPVNTTGTPTTTTGAWTHTTSFRVLPWRLATTATQMAWYAHAGLYTPSASEWEFIDRVIKMHIALQDNPDFATAPGRSYQIDHVPGYISGLDLVFYENWTDLDEGQIASEDGYLYHTQADYTVDQGYGSAFPTYHRGYGGWREEWPNTYYTVYATALLSYGVRRGITGAAAAYAAVVAAAGVEDELLARPGFYLGEP